VVSVLAGLAVLVALRLDVVRPVRPLAALAVAAVAWGWAIAQYPDVLPPRLTIAAAAAPAATEVTELIVVGIIVVLVVPSFAVLFRLAQSGRLGEAEATSARPLAAGGRRPAAGNSGGQPAG
jgi:cytochrome d ubiquinol oxidase subunit II